MFDVREYLPSDEPSWLQCRLLSFFQTNYYDDVKTRKTELNPGSVELVAVDVEGRVVGLLDVEIDGVNATIDSIAVDPNQQRYGIATAMLTLALSRLPSGATTIDAWTREDQSANAWYQSQGFVEHFRYLHVYREDSDPALGWATPEGMSVPVTAFAHAKIEYEEAFRRDYRRVYVCRQYVKTL